MPARDSVDGNANAGFLSFLSNAFCCGRCFLVSFLLSLSLSLHSSSRWIRQYLTCPELVCVLFLVLLCPWNTLFLTDGRVKFVLSAPWKIAWISRVRAEIREPQGISPRLKAVWSINAGKSREVWNKFVRMNPPIGSLCRSLFHSQSGKMCTLIWQIFEDSVVLSSHLCLDTLWIAVISKNLCLWSSEILCKPAL